MSVLLSLAMHLLVIALPLTVAAIHHPKGQGSEGDKPGQGQSGQDEKYTFKPPATILIDLIDVGQSAPVKPKLKRAIGMKSDCKEWYGGIGVGLSHDAYKLVISEVPLGYPADAAGILVGDEITSREDFRGPPGSVVLVTGIHPSGYSFGVRITRAKICVSK